MTTQSPEYVGKAAHKETKGIQKGIERTIVEGQGALALWVKTEGDIFTFISVSYSTNEITTQGDKIIQPEMLVAIHRSNVVTGDILMDGTGFSSNFQFNIDKKLQTAQLTGTVEMVDFSGPDNQLFPLTVEMNWTGYGAITKEKTNNYSYEEDGFKYKSTSKGESRLAVAKGTVFALEENFTIGNSTDALLSNNKSGTLVIEHKNKN